MINFKLLFRTTGLIFICYALMLIPPILVAYFYADNHLDLFLIISAIFISLGALLWYFFKRTDKLERITLKDGFLLVVFIWLSFCLIGSIPFIFMDLALSKVDAIFESFSALTTTGATIITNLEDLPKSILFYRQQLQWFGGMGLIVLAVAIFPILGVGAMQLYQAEMTGPIKNEKISPNIGQTAKILWSIYVFLTVCCAFFYYSAGMNLFDAISHSFSTVSIGGMSTYDANFAHFNNDAIEWVAIVFMVLSAMNYSLHFYAISSRNFSAYYRNAEWRIFIYILIILIVLATMQLTLAQYQKDISFYDALRLGSFQAISYFTTTGYSSDDISVWPYHLILIFFIFSFVGGCAGSTTGGVKVVRLMVLLQSGFRQIFRSIYPNAISRVNVGNHLIEDKLVSYTWGFFSLYLICFVLIYVSLLFLGLDLETSFSATAATINNLGPALGEAINNYASLPDLAKIILSFSMLLGRLEILGVLVLFSAYFWR